MPFLLFCQTDAKRGAAVSGVERCTSYRSAASEPRKTRPPRRAISPPVPVSHNAQFAGSWQRDQRTSQENFDRSACTVFVSVCVSHALLASFQLAKSSNTIVMSLTIFRVCGRALARGSRLKLTLQELEHLRSNEKRYESESAEWLHNHSALFERLLRHGRDGH